MIRIRKNLNASSYIGLFCALLFASPLSWAVSEKTYQKISSAYKYKYTAGKVFDYAASPDKENLAKLIKAQESKRGIASESRGPASALSSEYFESKMSPEFRAIRDQLLQIDSGEKLDQKLSSLDKNFQELKENDSRFFVAQIIPLRSMRGIVWRLKPLVADFKLTHAMLVTMAKNIVVNAQLFFPTNQTKALTEYLIQPFVEDGNEPWSHSGEVVQAFLGASNGGEAQLQTHIQNVLIPMLETAASRVATMAPLTADWRAFDNRLWYGVNTFPDAMDRYALVGEVERQVALANLYAGISELSFQAAYSWNGSMQLSQKIANQYGFEVVLNKIDGVPLEKRVSVIRSGAFKDWGTLQNRNLVSKAWDNLNNAVAASDLAWRGMQARVPSEVYLYNNSSAMPFQRIGNLRMQTIKNLIASNNGHPAVITSAITKETIAVDLKGFYSNPPADLKNLYPLPSGFKQDLAGNNEQIKIDLNTNHGVVTETYRDYMIGSGQHWDISANSPYRRLFPDLTNDGEDFIKHVRILSQGWGSGLVAVPISNYVQ